MSEQPLESPRSKRRRLLRPAVLVPAGAVLVGLFVAAMLVFEPWTLFTDTVVDEALPVAPAAVASSTPEAAAQSPGSAPDGTKSPSTDASPDVPSSPEPASPVVLARGSFISHEHGTTGSARVLELEDGTRVLRIEDLNTSNGPDLHVWITDAPVIEGRDGWFVFDDGDYVELGALKGNQGNQNYALPQSVDLDELSSVTIWCKRFRVSFGAVELS
jgi:Electron transfer DM13